ncbi:MAG: hypothetical protein NT154_35420 [Verrucomicrobia bacterium]|nr:hypothetical protein [Verrucomicrobiota bacterium]
MKPASLASLAAVALTLASSWAAENQSTNLDNTILSLALAGAYPHGGYVVVHPKAELDTVDLGEAQYIKDSLSSAAGPSTNGVVGALVDQLFERNKGSGTRQAVRLTLVSSLTNGYVVDHDGKYARYFRNDGGSWPRLYEENPKVRGVVTVSLPACDKKTGLVVLYKGIHEHGLQGRGEAILYMYESGKLRKLKSITLWIA